MNGMGEGDLVSHSSIPLLPELQAAYHDGYVSTRWFQRKIRSSADHLRLNQLYRSTMLKLNRAIAAMDWETYVAMHLPEYRESAFMEHFEVGEIPAPLHNQLVGKIWTDDEILHSGSCFVLGAMRTDSPHTVDDLMTRSELEVRRDFPEFVTAYRSHLSWNQIGPCWTLSKQVAIDFALNERWPVLTTARIPSCSIVAYFERRGEDEIVLRPFAAPGFEVLDQQTIG